MNGFSFEGFADAGEAFLAEGLTNQALPENQDIQQEFNQMLTSMVKPVEESDDEEEEEAKIDDDILMEEGVSD